VPDHPRSGRFRLTSPSGTANIGAHSRGSLEEGTRRSTTAEVVDDTLGHAGRPLPRPSGVTCEMMASWPAVFSNLESTTAFLQHPPLFNGPPSGGPSSFVLRPTGLAGVCRWLGAVHSRQTPYRPETVGARRHKSQDANAGRTSKEAPVRLASGALFMQGSHEGEKRKSVRRTTHATTGEGPGCRRNQRAYRRSTSRVPC